MMASMLFATARRFRLGLTAPALFLAALLVATGARAQVVPVTAAPQAYTPAELQTLVGPIALYVDDLIGIVLPASAYPLQVVQAARFLDARAQNPSLQPDPNWDDSVVALLNYPEVLRMMDQNLDWTAKLGEAFVYQQMDLLSAIQQFRFLAQSAGNLRSNDYQTVARDNGAITIAPANPQVIYVPYYEPARVVTYYSSPVVRYYPYGYPVYDYPYPAGYSFSAGFFWGVTTAFVLNWHTHYVNVYPWHYARHPYYGHRYYDRYYVRRDPPRHYDYRDGHNNVWRPSERWGRQPYRPDDRRDRYTHTERQVRTSDRHGSSLTPAIASAFTNSTRTQSGAVNRDDRRRPASNDGHRGDTRSDGYRATFTSTVKAPAGAVSRSAVPRTPLKPPRTAQVVSPARVVATPPRPASSQSQPRVARPAAATARTPPARSTPTQTAQPRVSAAAANRAPVTTGRPPASPRTSAPPPRAAPNTAANGSRPPRATTTPAPARQPKSQKEKPARQDDGNRQESRGRNRP